ncbi:MULTISPECIES: flavodoxin [Caproicibacterium]|uniref:Flavodoxin n=1 Tax=Caproicibacterium argilliputei TaxID=3030016 RepID=A0AA97DA28_9FIRM|nr:flavodoxin [Caproicibacterium argilliputei]WOC31825.1 flavodoxin [Caproicibacterium argilliputei]
MKKTAVVYWSGTGNTETMANLVLEGISAAGGQGSLFPAGDFSAEQAKTFEAFALGCPSMGTEQLEESEFEPLYEELKPLLSGKPVVLFGSYGWGDGEWMRNWAEDCESAGANLVAEPVTANGAPDTDASEACKALGQAVAKA